MKFTYPRELSFYHPNYKVGCGGNEVPMASKMGTILYVWNIKEKRYEYYHFEHDRFYLEGEIEI